jgi:hypothetical protein
MDRLSVGVDYDGGHRREPMHRHAWVSISSMKIADHRQGVCSFKISEKKFSSTIVLMFQVVKVEHS